MFWDVIIVLTIIVSIVLFIKLSMIKYRGKSYFPFSTRLMIAIIAPLVVILGFLFLSTIFVLVLVVILLFLLLSLFGWSRFKVIKMRRRKF